MPKSVGSLMWPADQVHATEQKLELGTLFEDQLGGGRTLRYVQSVAGATALNAGDVVIESDEGVGMITKAGQANAQAGLIFGGVIVGATVLDDEYGMAIVGGRTITSVRVTSAVVDGSPLIAHAHQSPRAHCAAPHHFAT